MPEETMSFLDGFADHYSLASILDSNWTPAATLQANGKL